MTFYHIAPDDPLNTPDLTPDERNALDRNTVKDLTTLLHIRNAYAFIHACVDDHQVAGLLEICAPGHARQAMDAIRRFFLPNSHAGRRAATQKFNNATMANTQTNIIEWIALVRQNATYLKEVGGQADDEAQMTVLIGGLLPEFDLMKHTLDQNKNLDLTTTISDLVEYSRTQGLLALAKGKGSAQSGSKVFNVADRNNQPRVPSHERPCRAWAAKNCTWGEKCKFSHSAPGAFATRRRTRSRSPQGNNAPEKDKEETSAFAVRDREAVTESRAHWHKPPPTTPAEEKGTSRVYVVRALPDDQVATTMDDEGQILSSQADSTPWRCRESTTDQETDRRWRIYGKTDQETDRR